MDLNQLWTALRDLVKRADEIMPGATGQEKKAWVVEQATQLVERYDHLLPLVGAWADLPAVDSAQRYLIGLAVERAWTALQIDA